jgi:hypothetical protein
MYSAFFVRRFSLGTWCWAWPAAACLNGFSLVRKCIERASGELPTVGRKPFKNSLMEPTACTS